MFQTLEKSFNGESNTGIGLNLVKKFVDRNDVSIEVNNNSDAGCNFVISNLEMISYNASPALNLVKKIF